MGKVSPVSTKYIIHANITIEGNVDRPDVIGAIFGQTEGFLGQELELRELQRSGKVGRIEVKIDVINGKSAGQIIIPCSLDKAETAIIAAALETIERIGPCNSAVKIDKIEDVRISKREFVITRAKELLSEFQSKVLPDSQEITEEVAQSLRTQEITEWGSEKLPAGPGIDDSDEVILVEGRADVINLLKAGFKNAIAMNGTSVPETIKELCKQKTVTVFVDGDRGGDIILKELFATTEPDFIVKAPVGKEVEELTKKEIHICLRARIASEQYRFDPNSSVRKPQRYEERQQYQERTQERFPERRNNFRDRPQRDMRDNGEERPVRQYQKQEIEINQKAKESFKVMLEGLVGTRGASLVDKDYNVLGKVPTRELEATLKNLDNVFAVVLDGAITKEIAQAAEKSKVSVIVGSASKVKPNEVKVSLLTASDL